MHIRFPGPNHRIVIVGSTGSGKTGAGIFHLSNANFDNMPWVIYDFKRDENLAEIMELDGAYQIGLDYVPTRPGLYFVQPHPDDIEPVKAQMMRIWEKGKTGLYVDEGYMVCGPRNNNPPFRTILTQGRSLRIPVIINSQRPVWLDTFAFSEADFYQVFDLTSKDKQKMMEYVPSDISKPLPEFHSYYHDVAKRRTVVLTPVPFGDEVLLKFERKLASVVGRHRRYAI